jgi:hypothetical protein
VDILRAVEQNKSGAGRAEIALTNG